MKKIIFFDLETTGLDQSKDYIISIAAIKVDIDTDNIIETLEEYVRPHGPYNIAFGAYLKHKISPDMLKDKPTLAELAPKIIKFFDDDSAICTYNGNRFDIPFFIKAFKNIGYNFDFSNRDCYDAFVEEKRRNGNTLEDVYKKYVGQTMEESGLIAHEALSDVKATYTIFKKQQEEQQYGPEKRYGDDAVIIDYNIDGQMTPCFSIGKYRGAPISYVAKYDQQYLTWCISDRCNFLQSTKNYIKQFIQ